MVKEEGTEQGNVGGEEGPKKEMEKGGKAERTEAGREERPPSPKRVKSEGAAEGAESGIPLRRKDLPNRLRYILVGKKELPPVTERRGLRFWAFVEFITDDPQVCPLPFRLNCSLQALLVAEEHPRDQANTTLGLLIVLRTI